MAGKAKGGRGKKAKNPYERFTVTLPPDLKEWLDDRATRQNLSRSEALALLLEEVRTQATSATPRRARPAAPEVLPGTLELFAEVQPVPVTRPPAHTPEQVMGSSLTPRQARVLSSLKLPDAVAEYDFHECQWLAGFAGVRVNRDDLEELTRLGLLTKTGEGNAAVYRLA